MTNLGFFVDDLEELYEDTKTNYNNLFMSLTDNDKQRYIKTLSVAFSETHDLSIGLQYFVKKNTSLHSHYTMGYNQIFTLLSFFCNLKSAF